MDVRRVDLHSNLLGPPQVSIDALNEFGAFSRSIALGGSWIIFLLEGEETHDDKTITKTTRARARARGQATAGSADPRNWSRHWPTCFWKHSARGDDGKHKREASMNPKITPDHLGRGAVVYVRQSTMGQVAENTESQRRQYALAESARTIGFCLGRHHRRRSGSIGVWFDRAARLPEAGRLGMCRINRRRVLHRSLAPRPQRPRLAPPDRPMCFGRRHW